MSRFKTNQRGPLRKKHIFLIILIIISLISIQGFIYVERNLEPALKEIARTYVKQLAMLAINDAISKKISEDMAESSQQYVHIEKSGDRIIAVTFDQARKARILSQVIDRTNEILIELEKDPIQIPIGQALNSNILAQLGPNVPITLVPMGAARADMEVRLSEAGINNVAIEVILIIEADVRIVIPFSSDEAIITTEFPIDVIFLPGEVPQYYFKSEGGGSGNMPVPNISIPAE